MVCRNMGLACILLKLFNGLLYENRGWPMREWEECVENTAREIEEYLVSHPQAADSLEGIATWWLSKHLIRYELNVVFAALRRLIQADIVSAESTLNSNDPFYRLNNKRQ